MGQGKERVKGDAGTVALMGLTKSRQVQAFASGKANKKRSISHHIIQGHSKLSVRHGPVWSLVPRGTRCVCPCSKDAECDAIRVVLLS